jgi:hypothetical protein
MAVLNPEVFEGGILDFLTFLATEINFLEINGINSPLTQYPVLLNMIKAKPLVFEEVPARWKIHL